MSSRFKRKAAAAPKDAKAAPKTATKPRQKPGPKERKLEPAEKYPGLEEIVANAGTTKPITYRHMLAQLGQLWATKEEVAAMLRMSRQTLYSWFEREPEAERLYEEGKLVGNVSQRRRNVALAEKNAIMSIFLSKNQLGMRDQFDLNGHMDHHHTGYVSLLGELDGKVGKVIEHDPEEAPAPRGTGKVIEHQSEEQSS